jgi:hypothetical protein
MSRFNSHFDYVSQRFHPVLASRDRCYPTLAFGPGKVWNHFVSGLVHPDHVPDDCQRDKIEYDRGFENFFAQRICE